MGYVGIVNLRLPEDIEVVIKKLKVCNMKSICYVLGCNLFDG